MEQKKEIYKSEVGAATILESRRAISSIEQLTNPSLQGESFENAKAALVGVEELQSFRKKTNQLPFGSFHGVIEEITNLNKLQLLKEEKENQMDHLLEKFTQNAARLSPRVADLYSGILAEMKGEPYESKFEITKEKIHELKTNGDLDILFSPAFSWEMKLNRIETRLTDYLLGARAFDKREGKKMDDDFRKWREEELKKAPTQPPERKNESKPGVDPMERLKEGERAPAIWSIYPAWGGYYREQSFSKWDSTRNIWVEGGYVYTDAKLAPLSGNTDYKKGPIDIIMTTRAFTGQWVMLPIPYTHELHKIEAGGHDYFVKQDQNGDLVIFIQGSGEVEVKALLAPHTEKKFRSDSSMAIVPEMPSEFTEETDKKLEEIKNKKHGNIARACAVSSYVVSRIKYLAPKDRAESERYNSFYNTHPKGFAGAVDEIKEGDCDVVNTYFAALCSKLNIPVRHVVGHSVKGKNKEGASSIHSGTGHGWSEVLDEASGEWVRMDATPPGDPNLEKEEGEKGEFAPGDYSNNQEVVRLSDEQLEEVRKKLAEHTEKLNYTKEERQLAESAGIKLEEARQIVREIKEAESARLPNGELVVDVMASLFDIIAESRKRELPVYTGPVRRREGGENISDIIKHYISVQAGESDPVSRGRLVVEIKEEKLLNGMDVYVIGDKSGSMQNYADGENLWKMQRRFEYLLFSSLYRFNCNLEKTHLPADKNLDVRTMAISFRGNGPEDIDLDKPLSPRFTAENKVAMWNSLSQVGGCNGDVAAIQYMYQHIKKEKEVMTQQGIEDNRLRIVVAYSDGGYVGEEKEVRAWVEELSKLGVVAVGIGLTESAASVPIVMHNPPKSFGEIVSNSEELIVATAKHIVLQAIKLFPKKAYKNAERLIGEMLYKFEGIK